MMSERKGLRKREKKMSERKGPREREGKDVGKKGPERGKRFRKERVRERKIIGKFESD